MLGILVWGEESMKWRNWLSAVIGLWMIISPWALELHTQRLATNTTIIVGAIQLIVSVWAATAVQVQSWKTWQNWVAFLCGFWFILQPFTGHYELDQYYTTVVAGVVTIIVNIWSLIDNREAKHGGNRAGV